MRKPGFSNRMELTELEGVVLGLIRKNGPCTPYAIRIELKKSPSPYWRGSSGTIYPIIERLAAQGLIKLTGTIETQRGGRLYNVSKKGENALRDWIFQPASPLVTGLQPDAVRTRIEFLPFLTSDLNHQFLIEVRQALERQVEYFRQYITGDLKKTDLYEYLVSMGSLRATQARLDWIIEITEILRKF